MKSTVTVVALLIAAAALASAQTPVEREPGYVGVESLGLLDPGSVEVNINLTGAMLQALASSSQRSDTDLATLLQDVQRVRVLSGPVPAGDVAALVAKLHAAVVRLESEGWIRLVSIHEKDDEEVAVLSLESGSLIHGIAVLVLDGDEAVVVNVVGSMRPEVLGRLLGSLDSLDHVTEELAEAGGAPR